MVKESNRPIVSTRLPMEKAFLPLATSFVEKGAVALGLGEKEALALTLATEEIFSYLSHVSPQGQTIEIRCTSGVYFVRVDFLFSGADINMHLFNLTATVSLEDEESLQEMGLLIASRFVDRLLLKEEPGTGIRLSLRKEKAYPLAETRTPPTVRPLSGFSIRPPLSEELKIFTPMVCSHYPPWLVPGAFRFPGKVVDMVAGGEYQAALAVGDGDQVGGGIIWHWIGLKTVECFGPYLFGQGPSPSMSEALLETCLGAIAKTPALGLLIRLPTEDLPRAHFEALGSLTIAGPAGQSNSLNAYFRQIHEDLGTASWCHPELEPFLREEYTRLVLPREIRGVRDLGERKNPFSVLSAEVDRSQSMVTLRPLRSGGDAEKNILDHIRLFHGESLGNIFFEMDLGEPWQAPFTPGLLKHGFRPRLVLPYAGEGDIVVFQGENSP